MLGNLVWSDYVRSCWAQLITFPDTMKSMVDTCRHDQLGGGFTFF